MSNNQKDQTNNFEKASSQRGRPVYFGFTDLLFSRGRKAWVLVDLVITFFMFNIGIWLSPYGNWGQWRPPFLLAAAVFSFIFCFVGTGAGYYDRIKRFAIVNMTINGLFVALIATVFSLGTLYFTYYNVYGRWTLLFGGMAAYAATIFVRLPLRWVLNTFPYRFTIVGRSLALDEIVHFTSSEKRHAKLYNYIMWDEMFSPGTSIDVNKLISYNVGDIVVSRESLNDPALVDLALHALHAGCRVIDEISFYGHIFERVPIDRVSKSWLLAEGVDPRRKVFVDLSKRTFDILVSSVAIVVSMPIMIFISLLIKTTSKGPILFIQKRVGRFGVPFSIFKFRTMHMAEEGKDHTTKGFTEVNDARVTSIGRLIRPLHLDELPQLFNILLGQMSIVGPRPETIGFAASMRRELPLYDMRYLMRPGLTGHAQLHQGYAMNTVKDTKLKLSYDLYYLCNHSLTWDIRLILRTFFALMKGSR